MSNRPLQESSKKPPHSKWIGSDEAGKGDYFGPLVVAGVVMDDTIAPLLVELGVKDSKRLSDNSVKNLAARIKKTCPCSVVVIGPKRYNELYNKIGNLNRLLAWGHSRAIENILDKEECDYALADQFGDKNFIINALMEKGEKIEMKQRFRAESDMGVAAASILARAEFLSQLAMLSKKYGIDFPKGASSAVIETGKDFVKRYGKERLKEVAKIHFKTTKSVLAE
ncbi:MAG: ribonuclease HIII [Dehalococcoidia bacterium]|nr:ribonuclease HIII [Dehalococcoidia bacterium]